MSLRPPPLSTVLLGLLVLSLIGGLSRTLWHGTQIRALLATPARPAAVPQPLGAASVSTAALSVIQEHALFYRVRAYYRAPAASPMAPLPAPTYELTGAMVMPGKAPLAIVRSSGGGASHTVRPGEDLEGWQVTSIEEGKVVLTHEGQQVEIVSPLPKPGIAARGAPAGAVTALGSAVPAAPVRLSSPPGGAARPVIQPRLFQPAAQPPKDTPHR